MGLPDQLEPLGHKVPWAGLVLLAIQDFLVHKVTSAPVVGLDLRVAQDRLVLVDPVVRLGHLDQPGLLEAAAQWGPLDLQVAQVPRVSQGRSDHLVHQGQRDHLVYLDRQDRMEM